MRNPNGHPSDPTDRLSFGQAARLTGMPKAYLRELVDAGELAVFHVLEDGELRLRVASSSLVNAGLLVASGPAADQHDAEREVPALLALLREQGERIAALEDQRFQLGVQLGSALERIVNLEQQPESRSQRVLTTWIATFAVKGSQTETTPEIASGAQSPGRIRDVAWKLTDSGFQRSARIGSSLIRARPRLAKRSQSSSTAD